VPVGRMQAPSILSLKDLCSHLFFSRFLKGDTTDVSAALTSEVLKKERVKLWQKFIDSFRHRHKTP